MKPYLLLICLLLSATAGAQSNDETAIRQLLDKQTAAWNQFRNRYGG